jgi:hypothetical protein
VKAVIYSCLSLISHPHLAHLRPKICSIIIENSFRIIHNSSKSLLDADDDDADSYFKELISWTLYACRYVTRSGFLSEYLPLLFSFICRHISDDISRTKLITECVVILLLNVDGNGSIAHPEVLYQTLGHPIISSYLHSESSSSSGGGGGGGGGASGSSHTENISNNFRERFLTSLCRGIIKLIPIAVAYVVSTDGKLFSPHHDPMNPENDSFGDSIVDLSAAIPNSSNLSSSSSSSTKKRLPYNGVGCYAELCDSTLRATRGGGVSNKTNESSSLSNSCSTSAELALQQLDNLIACALFVLRSSHQ